MTLIPGIHFPTNREEPEKQREDVFVLMHQQIGGTR
jgi:hypothetical protein